MAFAAAPLMPSTVRHDLKVKGATATLSSIVKAGQWEQFLAHVEAGQSSWLHLVPTMRTATDSVQTQALDLAVSTALTRNAAAVLRMADQGIDLERACVNKAIDSKPDQVKRFKSQARSALKRVHDISLLPVRDRCMAFIKNR
jgi:hypothetical protein